MDSSEKKQLFLTANRIRQHIIEGTFHAKSGHPGGSLVRWQSRAFSRRMKSRTSASRRAFCRVIPT